MTPKALSGSLSRSVLTSLLEVEPGGRLFAYREVVVKANRLFTLTLILYLCKPVYALSQGKNVLSWLYTQVFLEKSLEIV